MFYDKGRGHYSLMVHCGFLGCSYVGCETTTTDPNSWSGCSQGTKDKVPMKSVKSPGGRGKSGFSFVVYDHAYIVRVH